MGLKSWMHWPPTGIQFIGQALNDKLGFHLPRPFIEVNRDCTFSNFDFMKG